MKRWKRPKNKKKNKRRDGTARSWDQEDGSEKPVDSGGNCFEALYQFLEDVTITAVNEAGSSDLFRWE